MPLGPQPTLPQRLGIHALDGRQLIDRHVGDSGQHHQTGCILTHPTPPPHPLDQIIEPACVRLDLTASIQPTSDRGRAYPRSGRQ